MKSLIKPLIKPLIFILWLSSGSIAQAKADEAIIAVAANFTGVAKLLRSQFEKTTGHRLKISYGSTGKLYAQIENGAPYDVFLAADSARPIKAINQGLAVADTRFVYAKGQLALWSAKQDLFESGPEYLRKAAFKHIALANPKTAPYGMAAMQVMQKLGLASSLGDRLVQGDSIAQTFQFVTTGNSEAGFIAYSQLIGWKGEQGSSWLIPAEYYEPIEQSAVLLEKGRSNQAARAFLDFLKSSPVARERIRQFGYGVE